ncbi:Clavaminate synthase-like protein [Stipitochalara longipes BDJ]|nr:Clavaminate synthase-like protein [Stipitochalara longipes BDJ]
MPRRIKSLSRTSRTILQPYSTSNGFSTLSTVDRLVSPFGAVDLSEFRKRAFIPDTPLLITGDGTASTAKDGTLSHQSFPAAQKWFTHEPGFDSRSVLTLSEQYLSRFQDTILPYELTIDSNGKSLEEYINWTQAKDNERQELATYLIKLLSESENRTFHRFHAPLSLFLQACRATPPHIPRPRLYIAQAQISDLPKALQDDLPTPRIAKEAGKGDIYDANIWMGIPPTYTPLHKDPNPNLFVQLASSKRVRLFEPSIGSKIFRDVQARIGQYGFASFRGEEMMEGPERDTLDEIVWGNTGQREGYEATVSPGDALFIPKGWWHSINSMGSDVTASVNWWFR